MRKHDGSCEDLDKNLKHFKAKFLKWRYETLYECFAQLLPLRFFCENVLVVHIKAWFPTFKDGDLLNTVISALEDKELWNFIKVFHYRVFLPLEKGRRWGLVCVCCEHLRHEMPHKSTKCINNSRRLPQARKFVVDLVAELLGYGRQVDFAFAEGVNWIARNVSFVTRTAAGSLKLKSRYLDNVPVRVSEAAEPAEAAVCAEQLRKLEDADCTFLLLEYKERLLPCLDVRAAGGGLFSNHCKRNLMSCAIYGWPKTLRRAGTVAHT